MDTRSFEQFQTLIYEKSGIALKEGKEALVEARIGKRLRELGLQSEKEYLKLIQEDRNGEEIVHLLDAISTNVTQFFREPQHFMFLEEQLKIWAEEGQKRFRLWSAACSTGQEPYTLAMTAMAALDPYHPDLRILATDICTRVLSTAKAGTYPKAALKELPVRYQTAAFLSGGPDTFKFQDSIKRLVAFSRINLSKPPFPMKGPFDAIFCRNVMIYFDQKVRNRLVTEMFRLLRVGGYLMVGHSETLTGLQLPLVAVRPSVYKKEADAPV